MFAVISGDVKSKMKAKFVKLNEKDPKELYILEKDPKELYTRKNMDKNIIKKLTFHA